MIGSHSRLKIGVAADRQWAHRIERELWARLNWPIKYGHLRKDSTRYEVMFKPYSREEFENHFEIKQRNSEKRVEKIQKELEKLEKSRPDAIERRKLREPFPPMEWRPTLPVDPCVNEYLKENYGRELYLKLRQCLEPDEKYEFEQTASHDYGWRIRDYEEGKNKSMFASKDCTKEVFRNRGVFPTPEYPRIQHAADEELHNAQSLNLIS